MPGFVHIWMSRFRKRNTRYKCVWIQCKTWNLTQDRIRLLLRVISWQDIRKQLGEYLGNVRGHKRFAIFSSRPRDIRSSKTSSAIYEPVLLPRYILQIFRYLSPAAFAKTLVRVMLSPSFVNRFHIFVPVLFSESDIARDFHNSEKLSFALCDRAKSKTPFSYIFFSNVAKFCNMYHFD